MSKPAQENHDFLIQLQKDAREAFIPKQMLAGESSVTRIHELWLDGARSMMVGSPTYGAPDGLVRFNHGPSSWAMLATKMKVFDDAATRVDGVPTGCGYTDGSVLHVPLSMLNQAARTGDCMKFLGWLDEGAWAHAHAALGFSPPELEKWKRVVAPVDEKARDSMLYALSCCEPEKGMWRGLWEYTSSNRVDEPPQGARLGLLRIASLINSEVASQKRGASPRDLGAWFIDRCIEDGVSIQELGIALNMAKLFFGADSRSDLTVANAWKEDFMQGVMSRSGGSGGLKFIVSAALDRSATASFVPMLGGHIHGQMKVIHAQSILMNHDGQAPDRRALAHAILDVQQSGYVSSDFKERWPDFMARFKQLTGGSNMENDRLCVLARIDPALALKWAVKAGGKMYGEQSFCSALVKGLLVNRTGLSDDDRLVVVKEYLDAGNGKLYGKIGARGRMKAAGLHALMLNLPAPWTQEASRIVLERDPSSALGLLGNTSSDMDELDRAYGAIFSAGIRPETPIKDIGLEESFYERMNKQGKGMQVNAMYARFNARKLSQATAQVQNPVHKNNARL